MALNLLERIQNHTHKNQEGCTSVEACELVVHPAEHCSGRENRNKSEENGTREGNPRHDGVKIFHSLLARLYTRDEATVLLHVFRHHGRVDRNGSIEICEQQSLWLHQSWRKSEGRA